MLEKNSYWIKDMASAFNMTVKEFSECIGYSRQSLYQAACGLTSLGKRRLSACQGKLDMLNKAMYEAEKAKAKEMFQQRSKMIDSFTERLSG